MNWQALSFDWNQVRALLATAEQGSFSGAARVLGTTQPTIGRQIAALEDALGVTLFERTARGPALTDAGRDLIEHVRAMGEAAALISMVASGQSQEVAGEVSVAATDLMAAAILPAILARLHAAHPGLRIGVVASNEIQNLSRREADIAIRHVRPEQPDLIARRLGDFRANLYAASAYLDRAGRPGRPRDLADHAFIGGDVTRLTAILHDRGIPVREESFVLTSDNGVVLWEAVRAGFGITMMPEILGEAAPDVEKALPDLPPLDFPIWLVTHRELRTSQRIRVVFDFLAQALQEAGGDATPRTLPRR